MSFFQPPPRTRFDLNFSIAGFPVQVHPWFWVMALLLGGISGDIARLLIWVASVFLSILIHELGHSIVMRIYGIDSYIVLHMMGGLAVSTSSRRGEIDWKRKVFISLAGPFAGFLLAAIVLAVVLALGGTISINWFVGIFPLPIAQIPNGGRIVNMVVGTLLWVNIFWGFINLFPVYPLDGGNVSRHLFVRADPWNGVRNSLWLSVISGAVLAIGGYFFLDSIYMALLFGILAAQSYQILQGRSGNIF